MALIPTAKTPPKSDFRDLTTLIYGHPKIGKSTFASNFEDALFLATEQGLNHLNVYQMPITSWQQFLDACNEIARGEHLFKTIVIDTIDNLYKLATEHMTTKKGVEHISDVAGFGKGYALLNNEFHRVLTKLSSLPYGLVMISHARTVEVDERTGKYTKTVPTLPEGARRTVIAMADMILFCDQMVVKGGDGQLVEERVIRTKPGKFWEAGDRTGRLPETLLLSYPVFEVAFNGGTRHPSDSTAGGQSGDGPVGSHKPDDLDGDPDDSPADNSEVETDADNAPMSTAADSAANA